MKEEFKEKGFARDKNTGAVVSMRHDQLREYKKRKQMLRDKDNRISSLENRLDDIEKMLAKLNLNI